MIELKNISKSFGNSNEIKILDSISFNIEDNDFITIFGPNGCGKSTLLNIIAKLINPTSGDVVYYNLQEINAFIFQDYKANLLPWKNVLKNIVQPLLWKNVSFQECKSQVERLLSNLEISIPLDAYPFTLSGGQSQLISILRSVIIKPTLLLADEPFSALDLINRWKLSMFLRKIWCDYGFKCVFVSHDIDEAIFLGNKLILLSNSPTIIVNAFDINLPKERTKEVLVSSEFTEIKRNILKYIHIDN